MMYFKYFCIVRQKLYAFNSKVYFYSLKNRCIFSVDGQKGEYSIYIPFKTRFCDCMNI